MPLFAVNEKRESSTRSSSRSDTLESGKEAAVNEAGRQGEAEGQAEESEVTDAAADPSVRGKQSPKAPTKAQREAHEITHVEYQPWCSHCVRGRGVSSPHKSAGDRAEDEVPLIGMDYAFPAGVGRRKGDEDLGKMMEKEWITMLVVKDSKSGAMLTMVVPKKGGADGRVVSRVAEWIDGLGYGRVRLRCDNEMPIVSLQEQIKLKRKADTIPETCMKGEKQANGVSEQAVREATGMLRTFKDHVEHKIGRSIMPSEVITSWIVQHVGMVVTRAKLGSDGRSAYHRLKGKPSSIPMAPIGEKILFQPENKTKWGSQFVYGVYLGLEPKTGLTMAGTAAGVHKCRTWRRIPDDEKWCEASISEIKGTPWDLKGEAEKEEFVIPERTDEILETLEAPKIEMKYVPKRVKIMVSDIEEHGATLGCYGCQVALRREGYQAMHTKDCRARLEAKVAETATGKRRVDAARERITEYLVKEVEMGAQSEEVRGEAAKRREREDEGASAEDTGTSEEDSKDGSKRRKVREERDAEQTTNADNGSSYASIAGGVDGVRQEVGEQNEGETQMMQKRRRLDAVADAMAMAMERAEKIKREATEEMPKFWDDVKGGYLDAKLVDEARRKEMEYVRRMGLYTKVPRRMAWERTGKGPVKTRWVDTDKAHGGEANIRSRIVGMEYKTDRRPELFSATPPLEAARLQLTWAAANPGQCLLHADVSRVYFQALAHRPAFIEILQEDWEEGDDAKCGMLNLSMYGFRDSALNWENAYSTKLIEAGFRRGKASPCVFFHAARKVRVSVHGDDFLAVGLE